MKSFTKTLGVGLLATILFGANIPVVSAATMSDYSITPPFIQETINPNLLLMIDNSASMYDLAYPDLGTATRNPYYCFDQTYKSGDSYVGNFEESTYYRYNIANGYFDVTNTFPITCTLRSPATGAGNLCINLDSSTPKKITEFIAKGNYLNWLTASKFDIEKKILTGGKYQSGKLISESRGCVGRGFVKKALTADYVEGGTNTPLGVTFSVKGVPNAANYSAPSTGGQTYLYIYLGNYNQGNCQAAIDAIVEGHDPSSIKSAVDLCLDITNKKDLETSQKIIYGDAIQRCWNAYKFDPPDSVGTNGYNDVKNKCPDIYKARGGIAPIQAGDADLLCSLTYAGSCYTGTGPDWDANSWSSQACVIGKYNDFCASLDVPPVTDPTDAPSVTADFDNLPAIISDLGVQAQLGLPLLLSNDDKYLAIKVAVASEPTNGLLQQYENRIRFGGMQFNKFGSATESASLLLPNTKVCSTNVDQTCTTNNDCTGGGICQSTTDLDGGYVFHYVGEGKCSVTDSIVCTTDANCPSGEKCDSAGVGNNTAGLVRKINDMRGATWTPFAEAFYDSIGYFAKDTSDVSGKTSRTSLRLNGGDFLDDRNPSQYYCQSNNMLIISDGMSTADRRSEVSALATRYAYPTGETGNCASYAGSKNLDDLAYLAYNYNINNFSTTTTTAKPVHTNLKKNEFIKTFVVFNGSDNGITGECNSKTLMNNTAIRGGGIYYEAESPAELAPKIQSALDEIVSGSASGTAASIVSNRGQSGANLISAIFYPEKDFGGDQTVSWIGDLQNYWYYFDPFITNSTIREDTSSTNDLNLQDDYRIDFVFDDATNKTVAKRYADDGKGNYTFVDTKDPDALKALWKAGRKLYERTLTTAPYRKFLINDTAADATTASLFPLTDDKFATLTSTYWSTLKNYLNVADDATATNVMKYIYGYDISGFRKRSVNGYTSTVPTANPATGLGVWKLGDVITSTPRVQSDRPQNGYHLDYGDATYESYVTSKDYGARGMVYVGANDGALHAISLGKVSKLTGGFNQARLTGTDAGSEKWAFIPQNALPYLKYFTDPNYTHLYYVDNSTLLVDASINNPTGCSGDYWDCTRATGKNSLNELNLANTSWRSILIGQMGLGGASRNADAACTDCVKTPMNVVNFEKHGLSSVFALDVTNPENPALKWEFSHPDLGYTTSEPAIVRINGKNASDISDPNKNGRWFVVFASGPTGPIDPVTHQFYAKSDKPLKLFVVDLNATLPFVQNSNYWIIDKLHDNTQIANAFGGSLATNAIDTDKNNRFSLGYYSTDVVYVGYVSPKTESGVTTWTDGGLLRLVTKDSENPGTWVLSKVIDGVGPVTASIEKLYDDADKIDLKPVLWLYFGTGRYYYKNNTDGIDAADNQMRLFGIKEPCYSTASGPIKDLDDTCTAKLEFSTQLTDQSIISETTPASLASGKTKGWFIDLDDTGTFGGKQFKAERVVTSPSAKTNGLLQFTTFKPTSDICGFGGETMFWLVNYGTGGAPAPGTLKGKIMIQLSTGAIVVVDLADVSSFGRNGRQIDVGTGKPPLPAPPADALRKPVKKILHIQER